MGSGAPVVAHATSNYVAWCIRSDAFVDRCHYAAPGAYTTDMSATVGFSLGESASSHASDVSRGSMRVHVDDVSRGFSLPLTNANDASDSLARIGARPVSYERLFYTSDSLQQNTSNDAHAGTDAGAWAFVDSSANVTFRWSADGSHSYITTSMDPCILRVQKARNDAACDYIRGGPASDVSSAALPPGLSTSAADTLVAQFDYAETFADETLTRTECAVHGTAVAVTMDDSVFTACVTEMMATHGSIGPVTTTTDLRSALQTLISGGYMRGLRSVADVSIPCHVVLSGTDYTAEAPVLHVTPQLFFHAD